MKAYLEIEMPTNCAHCMMWQICPALPNGEWPDYESILTNDVIGGGGAAPGIRHPDCPLVPVQPHGRLIDAKYIRDAIIQEWMDKADDSHMYKRGMEDAYEIIRNAPTIIPADPAEEGMNFQKQRCDGYTPITNADRIRVMTDEELADFINNVEAEAIKRAGRYLTKIEIERGKAQRLDWLRQEAQT